MMQGQKKISQKKEAASEQASFCILSIMLRESTLAAFLSLQRGLASGSRGGMGDAGTSSGFSREHCWPEAGFEPGSPASQRVLDRSTICANMTIRLGEVMILRGQKRKAASS